MTFNKADESNSTATEAPIGQIEGIVFLVFIGVVVTIDVLMGPILFGVYAVIVGTLIRHKIGKKVKSEGGKVAAECAAEVDNRTMKSATSRLCSRSNCASQPFSPQPSCSSKRALLFSCSSIASRTANGTVSFWEPTFSVMLLWLLSQQQVKFCSF